MTPDAAISCAAVICVRNEAAHVRRAIGDFIGQGIEVAVIDHGSTDGTREICAEFLGRGLVALEDLAWAGAYDQTAQLEAKQALIAKLRHDWVVHADADEWMHTRQPGETLLQGLGRLSAAGYNAVNFEEFVFLPESDQAPEPEDCKRDFLGYYHFAPHRNRLMRAWKRNQGFSNVATGGHVLEGPGLKLAPEDFVLRHYMVLSHRQAVEKYAARVFPAAEIAKGWHRNRLNLDPERLRLPDPASLRHLLSWQDVELDRTDPKALHYWDWPRPAVRASGERTE
jgi:glycosyltransferase involved in cell wall biosynthesis